MLKKKYFTISWKILTHLQLGGSTVPIISPAGVKAQGPDRTEMTF